jgi:hypothetical protein
MSYADAALIVAASGTLAGLLTLLVRRHVRMDVLRRHHEVGSAVFLQMGVVFAVLLAFVFNNVWGEYNAAAQASARECGNLNGAIAIAAGLPEAQQQPVREAIGAYLTSVVQHEWPTMARGQASPEAGQAFSDVVTKVSVLPVGSVRSEMLQLLADAHRQRDLRLFQAGLGMPAILWLLLILLSVTLVGFLLCFGIDYVWSQVAFTVLFAASLAFLLVVVRMMDFPFQGALALQPKPYADVLLRLTAEDGHG